MHDRCAKLSIGALIILLIYCSFRGSLPLSPLSIYFSTREGRVCMSEMTIPSKSKLNDDGNLLDSIRVGNCVGVITLEEETTKGGESRVYAVKT